MQRAVEGVQISLCRARGPSAEIVQAGNGGARALVPVHRTECFTVAREEQAHHTPHSADNHTLAHELPYLLQMLTEKLGDLVVPALVGGADG